MNWKQNIKKGTPGHPTYIRGSPLTIFLRARMGGERTRRASFHAIFRSGIRPPPARRSSNNLLHFSVGAGERGKVWLRQKRGEFGDSFSVASSFYSSIHCSLLLSFHSYPSLNPPLLQGKKEGGNCSLLLLLHSLTG